MAILENALQRSESQAVPLSFYIPSLIIIAVNLNRIYIHCSSVGDFYSVLMEPLLSPWIKIPCGFRVYSLVSGSFEDNNVFWLKCFYGKIWGGVNWAWFPHALLEGKNNNNKKKICFDLLTQISRKTIKVIRSGIPSCCCYIIVN